MPDEAAARIDRLASRNPAAVRLAMAVSLAARVEPDLLRRARLLVTADVAAESDLWWSELVATQNSSGLVLDPAVADALRARLAASDERDLRRDAWKLVEACHAGEADSIRLEELLNWHTVSGEPDAVANIEELLQAAAQEYLVGASEPTGGVRWILGALRRLPRVAVETPTAAALGAAAAVTLDRSLPDLGDVALPPDAVENWFPWLLSRVFSGMPPAEVPIILRHDALVVGRYGEEAQLLRVPPTDPVVLTAIWPEGHGTAHAELRWSEGEEIELPVATDQLQLVAINGERWTIRRRGAPEAPAGFDFSDLRAGRRLGVGFEALREQVITEVREVGGWIAIDGDAWGGKTYLLCAVLDQLEDEGAVVVQHFYGRGPAWWDEPDNVVDSLVAQLDAFAPGRPPFQGDRPYDRLFQALAFGMPDRALVVVALDGIPGETIDDVKSWMFRSPFPSLVPGGARFLVTTRAGMGVRDWLEDGDPFRRVTVQAADALLACEAYAYAHGPALARALGQPDRRTVLLDDRRGQLDTTERELLGRLLTEAGFEVVDPRRFAAVEDWRARVETAQIVLDIVGASELDDPRADGAVDPAVPRVRLGLGIPSDQPAPSPRATARQLPSGEFTVDAEHPLSSDAAVEVVEVLERVAWPFVEEIVALGQGHVNAQRTLVDWLVARAPGTASLDAVPPTLTGAMDAAWSELYEKHAASTLEEVLPILAVAQPGFTLGDLIWLQRPDEREPAVALVASLHRLHLLRGSPDLDTLADVAASAPWDVVLERHGGTELAAELGVEASVTLRFGQPSIDEAHASIAVAGTNPSAPPHVVHHGVEHARRSPESGHMAMLLTTMAYLVRRQRLDGLAALEGDLNELVRVHDTPYSAALLAGVQALATRSDLTADDFAPALHHELSLRLPGDPWVDGIISNEVWRPALRFSRRIGAPGAIRDGQIAVAGEVVAVTGGVTRLALARDGDVASWTDREPLVVASVGPVGGQARIVSAGTNVFVVDGPRAWHLGLGAGTVEPLPSPGADAIVTFLAPTSNGIVTATADGLVRAWWQPGWQAGTFAGHRDAITAVAEGAEGFVTASEDGTVLCWGWEQAAPRLAFRGHHRPVRAVAVLGQAVVSAGDDGTLRWWSAVTGDELAVDGAAGRPVTACATAGVGHQVVWGDDSGRLGSWDPATGQRHTWPGHRGAVLDIISAGPRVISRAADGSVGVWDLGPDGDASGHLAAFGAQDAVKAGNDLVILAGGAITTTPIDALTAPRGRFRLAVDQRADFVAVAQGREVLTNLDIDPTWTTSREKAPVVDLGIFHAFGVARRLIWLLADGRVGTASPNSTPIPVNGGRVLATGESLAVVGTEAGDVTLLELGSGDVVPGEIVRAHTGPITAVAMGDGMRWASGGDDLTVKVWEREQAVATLRLHQTADHLAVVGDHLVTVAGGVVQVWSSTAELERTLSEGPAVRALSVVGHLVAIASGDGLVRLWDVEHGRLVDAVPTAEVAALASGDATLAVLDTTGEVTLWQVAARQVGDPGLRATVQPASGDGSGRRRVEISLEAGIDLQIRRVDVSGLDPTAPPRVAIDQADGWWDAVDAAGDLREPRLLTGHEPVRLVVQLDDRIAADPTHGTVDLLLLVSSPLLAAPTTVTIPFKASANSPQAS